MSSAWEHRVTVVLHRVPENEEYEGGYEAVTMAGVPENVIVTGSDRDSAEDALNHLIAGLRAFGSRAASPSMMPLTSAALSATRSRFLNRSKQRERVRKGPECNAPALLTRIRGSGLVILPYP